MLMGKFDLKPISHRPPPGEGGIDSSKEYRSEFIKACDAAGMNPHTVRRRMRPVKQRGQGMTLEEALAAPVLSRSEAGRRSKQNLKVKS